MLDPTAARPGEALGLTNRRPVCRQIASALEPGRVQPKVSASSTGCPNSVSMSLDRRRTESASTREARLRTRPAGRTRKRQLFAHQVQPTELLLRCPADPPIPGLRLERPRTPAQKRQPLSVRSRRHMPKAAARTSLGSTKPDQCPSRRSQSARSTPRRRHADAPKPETSNTQPQPANPYRSQCSQTTRKTEHKKHKKHH